MSERRVIKYYTPRLQIPVSTMTTSPGEYKFYCLPVDGAEALIRITNYLYREVTYIGQYIDERVFEGPTQAEMDTIKDVIGEMEAGLMSGCDLSTIETLLANLVTATEALACVCTQGTNERIGSGFGDGIQDLIDTGDVIPQTTVPPVDIPPQTDPNACAIAQLHHQAMYEMMTEIVLPAWRTTFDDIVPLVAAIVAGFLSGGAAALPAYAVAELLQELLELGYTASEENLINWMLSIKEEWVCVAYEELKAGGTSREVAQAVKAQVIDPSTSISPGDKLMVAFFGGTYAVNVAKQAWEGSTSWATENVTPGYCSVCAPDPLCQLLEPCVLGDWLPQTPGDLTCEDGTPQINSGYARYKNATVTQPAADFRLEVEWTAVGAYGDAILGLDLWAVPSETHINVPNTPPLAVGLRRIDTFTLNSPGTIGEVLEIQLVQQDWMAKVHKYCIRTV